MSKTYKHDLENDLVTNNWVKDKVCERRYAQNLYAALCNNQFQKLEVLPILKDEVWSCSWRYAGGIIANLRSEGSYMDWYCSGIEDIDGDEYYKGYVREGDITEEIFEDLKKLGWQVVTTYEEK